MSKRKFKTEVQQLLNLVVHSLYSNKDIFIRELVANAADAIDKARFESLQNKDIAQEWAINIDVDTEKNILSVSDNGIGMNNDEIIANIGTIAKSGTKAFAQALEQSKEKSADIPELIGQFGVGFYSAFMVAEKVEVISKKAGSSDPAVRWVSTGEESYEIEESTRESHGTTVNVYLKDEEKLYLEYWKVSEIVRKYSDFIEYPIIMPQTSKDKDGKEEITLQTLNSQQAIWLRKPSEITAEEHESFFSRLSHHGGKILRHIHFSAEGTSEFKALLYLPEAAPFRMFMPDLQKKGLQLYVRRVFISDRCEELVPDYMRFVEGVVDSSDLPLNVSREMLQDNPQLVKIRMNIVRKVLSELKKMLENDLEKYTKFFTEFGKCIKEGVHTDSANQKKLEDLLLYETMNNDSGKLVTLKEYVHNMPENQEHIYYIIGENRKFLEDSPQLEVLRSKGYDVLFMTDPIDEWVVQSIMQYEKKTLRPVGKGELDLDKESRKEAEETVKKATEEHKDLLEFLKKSLGEKVSDVCFSQRLTESACCLVADENAMTAHMERIFRAMNKDIPESKRILELNPGHPLIECLDKVYKKDKKNPVLGEYASLLFDQALLAEGSRIPDPLKFSKKVSELMLDAIK